MTVLKELQETNRKQNQLANELVKEVIKQVQELIKQSDLKDKITIDKKAGNINWYLLRLNSKGFSISSNGYSIYLKELSHGGKILNFGLEGLPLLAFEEIPIKMINRILEKAGD